MSKVYTTKEVRETAKLYEARAKTTTEVCSRRGGSAMVTVFASEGISDRKVASMLRQAADSMEREAAKDAEIANLRALVGELAQSLDASCDCHCHCDGSKMADESKFDCPDKAWRALVARARETIGGAK